VVFIESKAFTRRLRELAKDESDAVMIEIQSRLVENPMRGACDGLGGHPKGKNFGLRNRETCTDRSVCATSKGAGWLRHG